MAKKEKTNKTKGFVIAVYEHGLSIEPGTSFNKACNIIVKQFKDWQGKEGVWGIIPKEIRPPHKDSIKRWLKEERILERDFRQDGRYWIKQT